MSWFSRPRTLHRERLLHYILVGITFVVCYLLFGYWNVIGNHGGLYGYGCYDLAPPQVSDKPLNGTSVEKTPLPEAAAPEDPRSKQKQAGARVQVELIID